MTYIVTQMTGGKRKHYINGGGGEGQEITLENGLHVTEILRGQ